MSKIYLFDKTWPGDIFNGLRPVEENPEDLKPLKSEPLPLEPVPEDEGGKCLACQHSFSTRETQVGHYKSDWHRYNLKIQMNGGTPVSEEKFVEIIDDVSSISGSDTENSDDTNSDEDDKIKFDKAMEKITISEVEKSSTNEENEKPEKRTPKFYFKNPTNQSVSLYKCIFPYTIDTESSPNLDRLKTIQTPKCCIILLSAGHFAACVFEGSKPLIHKTFHRYVLRAKQGTVQSVRDKQSGGSSKPKSGGAALRRYNEMALTDDIQNLLNSWKAEFLSKCTHIFMRAPHYSKATFYNGKSAPLDRKDTRIRGIPFPTRRPTFNELKRVHRELYSIQMHDKDSERTVHQTNYGKSEIDAKTSTSKSKSLPSDHENVKCEMSIMEHNSGNELLSNSAKKRQRKRDKAELKVSNELAAAVQTLPEVETEHDKIIDELFTVCKTGDLDGLKAVSVSIKQEFSESFSCDNPDDIIAVHFNQPINKNHDTLLHIASKAGHRPIVLYLLEFGADPSIKNRALQVPYSLSLDKPMRNSFRRFMAENPERYDYKTALIPAPLTEEAEKERKVKLNEKKKTQKALKKERTKELRAEIERQEAERQEKERFANLSDREKRAIAAERRFAHQLLEKGNPVPNHTKRCWLCGESLLGKIPFEYFDFQFCTIVCLKKHKALEKVNN